MKTIVNDLELRTALRNRILTTQAAAAEKLGISAVYFGELLRGEKHPSDEVLAKLGLRREITYKRMF